MSFKFVYNDDVSRNSPGRNPVQHPGSSEQGRQQQVEASRNDGNQPGNRLPPFQLTGTVGEDNSRGSKFSSVLNPHGVRYECAGDSDCFSCWASNFSIPCPLRSSLDGDEASQPGSNRSEVDRRANAFSLPNRDFAKERPSAGCEQFSRSAEEEELIVPVIVDPEQTTRRDEHKVLERSIVDYIDKASSMVEKAKERKFFFSGHKKKQVLGDLAVLDEYFSDDPCLERFQGYFCLIALLTGCVVVTVYICKAVMCKKEL